MPAVAEQGINKYDMEYIPDRYAVVFTPQGSQTVGAGLVEYEHSSVAREIMDRANDAVGFWATDIAMAGPARFIGLQSSYTACNDGNRLRKIQGF